MSRENNFSQIILEVSKDIFTRYGFQKTSMEMIAKACGKAKSSIYYYYKSKEDIFEAVVEHEVVAVKNELSEKVRLADTTRNKLKVYILTRLNTLDKFDNLSNALRDEYLSHLGFINSVKNKYRTQELNMVREILYHGKQENMISFDNVDPIAKALVLAISGLELEYILFPTKDRIEDMETTLDNILDVFFKGMKVN